MDEDKKKEEGNEDEMKIKADWKKKRKGDKKEWKTTSYWLNDGDEVVWWW